MIYFKCFLVLQNEKYATFLRQDDGEDDTIAQDVESGVVLAVKKVVISQVRKNVVKMTVFPETSFQGQ